MSTFPFLLTILGIGFMIFIHELGHYLAARWCGVRVLVFSLGFGPRLFGFQRNGTDYRISAIPVGGFVLVAGADEWDMRRMSRDALNAKSLGARAFYYSGGVIMNLLFALIAFPLVFHNGVQFTAPVVGEIDRGSAAWQADLRPGDRIRRVDGKDIYAFENMRVEVALAGGRPVHLEVERDGQRIDKHVQSTYDSREGLRKIGVHPDVEPVPPEVRVAPGSAAAQAGLRDGDRLLTINGEPVRAIDADRTLESLTHLSIGTKLQVEVERNGQTQAVAFVPPASQSVARIGIRPLRNRVVAVRQSNLALRGLLAGDIILTLNGKPFFGDAPKDVPNQAAAALVRRGEPPTQLEVALAFSPEHPYSALLDDLVLDTGSDARGVAVVVSDPQGPAARAGLQDGDVIASVSGRPVANWSELFAAVREFRGNQLACEVARGERALTLTIEPTRTTELGFSVAVPYRREIYRVDGVGNAIRAGLVCSADLIKQLYVTLREMVVGDVSARNLGGIIQISRVTYAYAESGWARFLYFLALLSLNLAFINVLPIPVLDGGHLLFLLIEKIKGSPVSARVHGYSLTLGLVFVVGLMVFVTYNDILRAFF